MAHYKLHIKGLVQGVGFRPFVYRLANQLNIKGEVQNDNEGVYVRFNTDEMTKNLFINKLISEKPAPSNILDINIQHDNSENQYDDFRIIKSVTISDNITAISPDIAICDDCINEMQNNPLRYDYPFINCTNCGPRFSIIRRLPYDRVSTSMEHFEFCSECHHQYNDINDRRFHAQPIACKECGPFYTIHLDEENYKGTINHTSTQKIILTANYIDSGKVICIKGLGGYNLICDAFNDTSVSKLRDIKKRLHKPLAVMFASLDDAKKYVSVNDYEEAALKSWRRPIVLLKQKKVINNNINDSLSELGIILPYAPIHALLFKYLKTKAIIFTSANINNQPIIFEDNKAKSTFCESADLLLSNNREIINPIDDSVIKCFNNKNIIFRRSRGFVPEAFNCSFNTDGILSLGAENNNYFAIGKQKAIIASQYIGNTSVIENIDFLKYNINRYFEIYKFKNKAISCDLHPHYYTSLLASKLSDENNIPLFKVQHHYAHALSVMLEHKIKDRVLAVVLDGAGYGIDNKIWGSEFLLCDNSQFIRLNHFDYIPLPGGDIVSKQPWRSAIAFSEKYNFTLPNSLTDRIGERQLYAIKGLINNNINTFYGCGTGRIFDAVSSLVNICDTNNYQGESAMKLESLADINNKDIYNIDISDFSDNKEIFALIINDINKNIPVNIISSRFHNTLALKISKEIKRLIETYQLPRKVILTGGCFQNIILLQRVSEYMNNYNIKPIIPQRFPMNDGGIALGQTYYTASNFNI